MPAMKRSKESGNKNRRESVTPSIHPCHVCLDSHIHPLDPFYIAQKPFPLLMNAPH